VNNLRLLTLDCATHTGWATNALGGVESGVQAFELRRGASPGMRYIEFRGWLDRLLTALRPEVVVYEKPIRAQVSAVQAELAYGFSTRVQEVCTAQAVDYRSVAVSTLKKWATGNGGAGKEQMKAAASERFGRPISDDNEADALLLLAWAAAGFPEAAPARTRKKRLAGTGETG
jgi:Holliday junction resolvasome RuvABC endonuclease subunit